ncbi:hypothetical protein BDN72DRAFT_843370 [Pluteus cervinus]|uniref:Uncharacterized protein n=1 Tax=Pluteus cervinus TaxID=181527 RepID=A0ACD3ANB3_9AGAR|nr:hypothetical protein BDN72DRAFT_843370 [Pluteus cervinus]
MEPTTSTETTEKPLAGTVPSHRCYIFMHSAEQPSEFPSRMSTPISRSLQLKAIKWGGVVNFGWQAHWAGTNPDEPAATVFSTTGGRLELSGLTLQNLDAVEQRILQHVERDRSMQEDDQILLFVCTHGARDCRCGNTGGQVFRALQEEVDRRKRLDPTGNINKVKIGSVGHVGGHAHAANVLVFPRGDWLGRLQAGDASAVLDEVLSNPARPMGLSDPPLMPDHWRGRMGLFKEEQIHLMAAS